MSVLFIENADSFSWNVIDRLPVDRGDVRVVSGADHEAVAGALDSAEVLVIGPGPQDPHRSGRLLDLVTLAAERRLPTLGVCLGHQAIGMAFGAHLVRGVPTHGKRSPVLFEPSRSFPRIEGSIEVMRYHSLSLVEVVSPLRVVARADDGTVMAVEHERLPIAGVQFHPDSYATERGAEFFEAFFRSVQSLRGIEWEGLR